MELVRFGHLGMGPADLILDTQLPQHLRYEKKMGYMFIMILSIDLH
jgi:hypothetical protein